ncbi:hypothetical protein V5799_025848 [Amblyomma americanum]|uniref:Uncharacterized protein n=1 Tax=Amblyomma americanum TaxID=6943 RepID=A0AAQ4E8A3_AMBAM
MQRSDRSERCVPAIRGGKGVRCVARHLWQASRGRRTPFLSAANQNAGVAPFSSFCFVFILFFFLLSTADPLPHFL